MRIEKHLPDEQILIELGSRFTRLRLEQNLTQAELARQAGVGVSTVQRLETGAVATQLSVFLRVCRVLGILDRLEILVPEAQPGPLELLEYRGRQRRRATGSRATKPRVTIVREQPWTWGDGG